jgi:hypothetical protein
MKSGAAAAVDPVTPISNGDCADRILKIVHKLQQQIKQQEADLQAHLERADTLRNRYELEISRLHSNFDQRLQEVVAQQEASERLRIDSAVTAAVDALQQEMREGAKGEYEPKLRDAEELIGQLRQDATTYANQWAADRQKLQERISILERNLDVALAVQTVEVDGYKDLERKLKEALHAKEQLQLDLRQAVGELNSGANSESKERSDSLAHTEVAAIVQAEMLRVRSHLDEIERALAEPSTQLGTEIRLTRDRAEMEAYLKGLRYSLGEVALQPSTEVSLQASAIEDTCHA